MRPPHSRLAGESALERTLIIHSQVFETAATIPRIEHHFALP